MSGSVDDARLKGYSKPLYKQPFCRLFFGICFVIKTDTSYGKKYYADYKV